MNNIRKLIKDHIRLIFNEMFQTDHFQNRAALRLRGFHKYYPGIHSDFPEDRETVEKVNNIIDFLTYKLTINSKYRMGISIKLPKVFNAYDPKEDKTSTGNVLWIISRKNDLVTLLFDSIIRYPNDTDLAVNIYQLLEYIKENGNKLTLIDKDLENLMKIGVKLKDGKIAQEPQKKIVNPPKEKEHIFLVKDKRYVLDLNDQSFHQKNKPEKKYNIYDILDDKIEDIILNDQQKDEVLELLIGK